MTEPVSRPAGGGAEPSGSGPSGSGSSGSGLSGAGLAGAGMAGAGMAGAGLSGPAPVGPPPYRPQGSGARGRFRQFAWASVPVWSLSLLAFAPFLRLALARRRARDWAVFAGYLAVVIVVLVFGSLPGPNDAGSAFAGVTALVLMGAAAVHTFVAFRPTSALAGELASAADPNELALASAEGRMRRRSEAREIARTNHVLARELRIGRPDIPREYDDGGLVDVNHVPGDALASCLGLTPQETAAVVAARDQLGRFTSAEELSAYAQLRPDRVDALRDWMLFC